MLSNEPLLRIKLLIFYAFRFFSTALFIFAEDIPDFRNPTLPFKQRLDDLIHRLTPEELIAQVSNGGAGPTHGPAPAIDRLEIRPYQWRSNPWEGKCTSFAIPVNQAATFDKRTVWQIGLISGLEMKANRNQFNEKGVYTVSELFFIENYLILTNNVMNNSCNFKTKLKKTLLLFKNQV